MKENRMSFSRLWVAPAFAALALAVAGDSCQDGSGPLTAASFTGLAEFTVKYGTGRYAGTTGHGLASFSEDAANHHHTTLIGRLAR
jgi:hypothetical protein